MRKSCEWSPIDYKAVFVKLERDKKLERNLKETKRHPQWCCHSNSFSSSLFLSKKQMSPFATPELRQRVLLGTYTVPILSYLPSIDCVVDGSWFKTKTGCHCVSFVMHIYGAKFQEHCFNISRDIVYSVFYNF